jgi:hypothetical protein
MYTCPNPSCKKPLPALARTCSFCQADLTLLAEYAGHLQDALDRADRQARAGKLGEAVWAYLQVLDVDPDNPIARREVGQVAAAVRQFDQAAHGRAWHRALRGLGGTPAAGWFFRTLPGLVLLCLVAAIAFIVGYQWPH